MKSLRTDRAVVESDLVIYVDTIQIPLNGGHKSVAVGMGTYNSIAPHHSPHMTAEIPHVMQPEHSNMHDCIERMSRVIEENSKIMVLEAALNDAIYPLHLRYLGKPNDRCNLFRASDKGVYAGDDVDASGGVEVQDLSRACAPITIPSRSTSERLTAYTRKRFKS